MTTFVYFISAGVSPIKIGLSDDPIGRLANLQTAHYKKLQLLYTVECATREDAFKLESAFHRWYSESLLLNEWYNIATEQIGADIELLMTLVKSAVHIHQHISDGQIKHIEQIKQAYRNSHTGEVDNAPMVIEDGLFIMTCPRCGKVMPGKPTHLQAIRALAAHIGKAHRKDTQS